MHLVFWLKRFGPRSEADGGFHTPSLESFCFKKALILKMIGVHVTIVAHVLAGRVHVVGTVNLLVSWNLAFPTE